MKSSTKAVLATTAAGLVLALVAVPISVTLLVASMFSAGTQLAAAADPCTDPSLAGSAIVPTGPVRAPYAGRFAYTSPYGMRLHPTLGRLAMHTGADLAQLGAPGPVLAVQAGRVVDAGAAGTAGNRVIIDHGAGLSTRYLHLASISVRVGQDVVAGQRIGVEGNTGRSDGSHLHLEVRRGEEHTDPIAWLIANGVPMPELDGAGVGAPETPAGASASADPKTSPVLSVDPDNPVAAKALTSSLPTQIGPYRGEQITNAGLIIRAGHKLGLDEHTIALGIMTGIGESSLRNLDHGDAAGPDSLGVFQQRRDWGPESVRRDVEASATLFFQALVKLPNYRQLPPTLAAHKIQINDDPNHYARSWGDAVRILAELTAHPDLLTSLPADGASAACDPAALAAAGITTADLGTLPGTPAADCPPTGNPAEAGLRTVSLRGLRCGHAAFPKVTRYAGVGTRPGKSEHPAGMAVDFMIEDYKTPLGRAYGWALAQWTRTHADNLKVRYIIFDMKIWSPGDPQWRPYTRYGPNPDDNLAHRDHVHVSYT